jgi:hypothetical protein
MAAPMEIRFNQQTVTRQKLAESELSDSTHKPGPRPKSTDRETWRVPGWQMCEVQIIPVRRTQPRAGRQMHG